MYVIYVIVSEAFVCILVQKITAHHRRCHNDSIGNECLNLHKILGKQKQNCMIKVRTENSESITHRTIESVPRAEASQIRKYDLHLGDNCIKFFSFGEVRLLSKIFLDTDFCHNYLHTAVVLN